MIRFRFEGRPGMPVPMVFLGLSSVNLHRLQEGMPIHVKADDEINLGVDLIIYHGKDEVEMTRQLEEAGFMPPGSTAKTKEAMQKRSKYEFRNDSKGFSE